MASEALIDLRSARAAIARAAGIVLGWHDRGLGDTDRKLRKHVRRFRKAAVLVNEKSSVIGS